MKWDPTRQLLIATIFVQSAANLHIFLYCDPSSSKQQLTYFGFHDAVWPAGRFEIMPAPKDKSIEKALTAAEHDAEHLLVLKNAATLPGVLDVAHNPVSTDAPLPFMNAIANLEHSNTLLPVSDRLPSVPVDRAVDADHPDLRYSSDRSADLQYLPSDGTSRKAIKVLMNSRWVSVGTSRVHISDLRSIRLAPLYSKDYAFSAAAWQKGFCDQPSNAAPRTLLIQHGHLVARGTSRIQCASHSLELRKGVNFLSVSVRASGIIPRATLLLPSRSVDLVWQIDQGALQTQVSLPSDVSAKLFVYADPASSNSKLEYRSLVWKVWDDGALLVRSGARNAAQHPAVLKYVDRSGLGYTAILSGCDSGCIIDGNWSFSPIWQALANGLPLQHLRANVYANSWIVPPHRGPITILVRYRAIAAYLAGVIVSVLTIVFISLTLTLRKKFFNDR